MASQQVVGKKQPTNRRQLLGRVAEQLAADYLLAHGYQIVARNYRCEYGELDIIALDPSAELVFVEVRSQRSAAAADPESALSRTKQVHLRQSAECYLLAQATAPAAWRIDLLVVAFAADGKHPPELRHWQAAIDDF